MFKQGILSTLRLFLGICLCWFAFSLLSLGEAQSATSLGLLSFFGLMVGMMIMPDAGT
jgi:hypothetical protein